MFAVYFGRTGASSFRTVSGLLTAAAVCGGVLLLVICGKGREPDISALGGDVVTPTERETSRKELGSYAHLEGTWRGTITKGEKGLTLTLKLRLKPSGGGVIGEFEILAVADRGVEKGRRGIVRPTWSHGKLTFLVPVGDAAGDGDNMSFELQFRDDRLVGTASEIEEGSARFPVVLSKSTRLIWLCEIVERNVDTFSRPLSDFRPSIEEPPFSLVDGEIVLQSDAAGETDEAKLDSWNLKLAERGTPLSQCRALVIYTRRYAGTGREGLQKSYIAYPDLPLTVEIPKPPFLNQSEWVYDRAREPVAFWAAIQQIRGVGLPAYQIQFAERPGNKVEVRLGEMAKGLEAGTVAPMSRVESTIEVTETAIPSEAVEYINVSRPQLPQDFLPAQNHGDITFTTEVLVWFHGVLPEAEASIEREKP